MASSSASLFGLADDDAVPELIVFDCDACLWSPEMFQLDSAPSEWDAAKGGVRAGRNVVRLFGGVAPAFAALASHPRLAATRVGLASSTRQPQFADAVLRLMRLDHADAASALGTRVAFREIFPVHNKKAHFDKLKAASGVAFDKMRALPQRARTFSPARADQACASAVFFDECVRCAALIRASPAALRCVALRIAPC
jgi:hypothetical protein